MSTLSNIESSAILLLKRAVERDAANRFTEALVCYQEGGYLLLEVLKGIDDAAKKESYRKKVENYLSRAEKIKEYIDQHKKAGTYHEQIHIALNSTGHDYKDMFHPFINDRLTSVIVEDPYIRSHHQVLNFLRFCEMLVKNSSKLKSIKLTTTAEPNSRTHQDQAAKLDELKASLTQYNIQLTVAYSSSLHDREIRFDNGWIIKIGRGLDYFKPAPSKFSIGAMDFSQRLCHETTVDIFHAAL